MKNPKIDDYIKKAQPFARPILIHIRNIVHTACPDVQETMKWSMPHFDFKGPFCGMAAFKEHCTFGFWKEKIMQDPHQLFQNSAMGHFGRITAMADLPSDEVLIAYIKEAMELNENGIKIPKKPSVKKELIIPDFFLEALQRNEQAAAVFDTFSYSKQKEYVVWIMEAKQESTKQKRLETALLWIAEGKSRNWKYENCT